FAAREITKIDSVSVHTVCMGIVSQRAVDGHDFQNEMFGADDGLVSMFCNEEIVQVEGVLRMIVAANIALGTINAGSLQRSIAISLLLADSKRLLEIIAEENIDIYQLRISTVFLGHLREEPLPNNLAARIIVYRYGPGTENFLCNCIVGKQICFLARTGPVVIKYLVRRDHEYVGIN